MHSFFAVGIFLLLINLSEQFKQEDLDDDDLGYLKTDPQYVYQLTNPENVDLYYNFDEKMLREMYPNKDWSLTGIDKLSEEEKKENLEQVVSFINQQNKAYKEGRSSFYCGPTHLSILGDKKMAHRKGNQSNVWVTCFLPFLYLLLGIEFW